MGRVARVSSVFQCIFSLGSLAGLPAASGLFCIANDEYFFLLNVAFVVAFVVLIGKK